MKYVAYRAHIDFHSDEPCCVTCVEALPKLSQQYKDACCCVHAKEHKAAVEITESEEERLA